MTINVEEPDYPADKYDELATMDQKATFDKISFYGWKVSHLWEYEEGHIAVWCIAPSIRGSAPKDPEKPKKHPGYTHCFILPRGNMQRYEDRLGLY